MAEDRPLAEAVFDRGATVSWERDHFVLQRRGTPEDAWFTWSYSPVPDDAGGVGGLLNVAHEVTAEVLAQAARLESDARHAVVLDALDEGLTVHDAAGAIVSANPSAQRILGLTLEQMRGVDSFDPRWRAITEDGPDFPPEQHPPQAVLRTG